MGNFAFVTQVADDILNRWEMSETIRGHTIASLVAHGATHWEEGLPSGASTRALSPFLPTVLTANGLLGQSPPISFWREAPVPPGEQGTLSPMVLLDKSTDIDNIPSKSTHSAKGKRAFEERSPRAVPIPDADDAPPSNKAEGHNSSLIVRAGREWWRRGGCRNWWRNNIKGAQKDKNRSANKGDSLCR